MSIKRKLEKRNSVPRNRIKAFEEIGQLTVNIEDIKHFKLKRGCLVRVARRLAIK